MAVRIRVYPQNGATALGMQGGAVSAQTYYTQKLQTQQQVSNLRLGYERALFNEKLDKVRLEERLKNPYATMQVNPGLAGAYALPGVMGLAGMNGMAALGGLASMGTLPMTALGGSGQTNVTNQTSPGGAASQSVSNVNTYNNSHVMQNPYAQMGGWGFPQGGGGFLSGLLGALI